MSKNESSDLTVFSGAEAIADRFPAFQRELGKRRDRITRFYLHNYGMAANGWDWMIGRCRNWTEVERVLNRHNVDWQWERKRATPTAAAAIALEGGRIERIV